MEKRLPLFLILSVTILWVYVWLFRPDPPPENAGKDGQAKVEDKEQQEDDEGAEDQQEADDSTTDKGPDEGIGPKGDDPGDDPVEPILKKHPREFISLGSLSPDSPFRFLVTLDSRAGAIRRIELNERNKKGDYRYREVIEKGGYLGDLGLSNEESGLLVNVVGNGTPAHEAGLQPQDIITGVAGKNFDELVEAAEKESLTELEQSKGKSLTALEAFKFYLGKTAAGDELELAIVRNGQPIQQVAVTLSPQPFSVVRPEVEWLPADKKLLQDEEQHASFLMTLGHWERGKWQALPSLTDDEMFTQNWSVPAEGDKRYDKKRPSVEFHYRAGDFIAVKRYSLVPTPTDQKSNPNYKSYHLELDVEVKNVGSKTSSVAYQLRGPTGLPTEGWWYSNKIGKSFGAHGARDVVWSSDAFGEQDFSMWGCFPIAKNIINDKLVSNHLFPGKRERRGTQLELRGGRLAVLCRVDAAL